MNKSIKKICLFTIVLSFVWSLYLTCYAETTECSVAPGNAPEVIAICNKIERETGSPGVLSCTSSGVVCFDNTAYENINASDRREYMTIALQSINKSSLGGRERNKLYNFVFRQDSTTAQAIKYLAEDTQTDFVSALKHLRPFSGGVSTFMGILTIIIFIFFAFSIIFDISYLALPMFQLLMEHGNPDKKPFGVSAEAWKVNREVAMDSSNNKGIISEFMKKRLPVVCVCAICLGYLISGKVYDILTFIADAFLG